MQNIYTNIKYFDQIFTINWVFKSDSTIAFQSCSFSMDMMLLNMKSSYIKIN